MDVTFMRRATAPVTMSGTAEEEDEGEEEKGGSAAGRRALSFRLACQLGWRLRRGRDRRGFVLGSLRVAGRRRAVLSVGPRRRTAGRKGSAYLRGYGEQQGQEGLATHREAERNNVPYA